MYIAWRETNDISSSVIFDVWNLPHENVFTELLSVMYEGKDNVFSNILTPYYILSAILRCSLFESIITPHGEFHFLLHPFTPHGERFNIGDWLRALDKTCISLYQTSCGLHSLVFHRPSIEYSVFQQKSTTESSLSCVSYRRIGIWNETASTGHVFTMEEHDSYQFRDALSRMDGCWSILSIGSCHEDYPLVSCDSLHATRSNCLPDAEYVYLLPREVDDFISSCCTIVEYDESQPSHIEDVTVAFISWWKRWCKQDLDDTICTELVPIMEEQYTTISCNGTHIHGLCINEGLPDTDSDIES